MNRKKIQNAGKQFGKLCKLIGSVMCIIGCAMTPNEDTIVNKSGVVLLILSLIIYAYGVWRTGSIVIELE